ncbi:MAG: 2,5-diamino-6-(ribosylamino)-4(3H)-pyrimidinone 5'-phosphate reductase [Candidatus Sigynarchaeum springense]
MDEWKPLSPLPQDRPYILLNAAMSIDAKISTTAGDSQFSDDADWRQVHAIRSSVDAIMVGVNTILHDDPSLRVKYYTKTSPLIRVVVDSTGRTPPTARVLPVDDPLYPTIICATKQIDPARKRALEARGAEIIIVNENPPVDVRRMLDHLMQRGIRRILLEGGGSLNWSMVAAGLIDEIRLCIAPVLVGGQAATTLVGGAGFGLVKDAPTFQLHDVETRDNCVILRYRRKNDLPP